MTPKPSTHNGDLAHLPLALRALCHQQRWVVRRWEWRKTKWTKPPRQPSRPGKYAKADDPTTWGTYEEALAAVVAGKADGIGFMLATSNIGALDLDHCVDPATGAMAPWAAELDGECNGAYREVTVSGAGLRIIGTASGAEVHRRFAIDTETGAGLELYRNTARYITISGCEVGQCTGLPSLDGLIDTLLTRYENNSKAKSNGRRFDFNDAGPQPSIDYDEVIRNGAPNGQRSELFQACVWHLAAKGMSVEEIAAELEHYPNGIGSKYTGRLQQEVERSYAKWEEQRRPGAAPDTEPEEPARWDTVDKNGKPKPTGVNTRRALFFLGIQCRYDAFHNRYLVESPLLKKHDNLDHIVQVLRVKILKAYGFQPSTLNTREGLIQLCLDNTFDPICDYLDALVWDGVPRLDTWLVTYTGADDTELNREFGRITLIAAVRRARRPGTKFDPILVLEGRMGTGKSTVFVTLAGAENHSDQTILGKHDREQQELLGGVWIFEIADLAGMKKADVEHLKAFASRTHDRAREAYGHFRSDQPRRGIVVATTNHEQYLKEADRRFWPVKTTVVDIEALKRDRDQLWAEVAQREREGASIVLRRELWAKASGEQQAREEHDPWDDILIGVIGNHVQGEERAESTELLGTAIGIHISRQRDIDFKRLGRCMRRLGWDGPKKTIIGNHAVKGYTRPLKGRDE